MLDRLEPAFLRDVVRSVVIHAPVHQCMSRACTVVVLVAAIISGFRVVGSWRCFVTPRESFKGKNTRRQPTALPWIPFVNGLIGLRTIRRTTTNKDDVY